MRKLQRKLKTACAVAAVLTVLAHKQTAEKPDLTKQPPLYVVGYAHLDAEWRWEYPQVIDEYLRKASGTKRSGTPR